MAMPIATNPLRASIAAGSGLRIWTLTVVDAADLTAGRRRMRLVSEIDGFRYQPGQPLVLRLPFSNGEAALRHFRVREFDAVEERLEVDFDLRGDRRTLKWLRGARIGDQLIAETPSPRLVSGDACLAA
jgi:NADPH-dependent ferric siderophore reductase